MQGSSHAQKILLAFKIKLVKKFREILLHAKIASWYGRLILVIRKVRDDKDSLINPVVCKEWEGAILNFCAQRIV